MIHVYNSEQPMTATALVIEHMIAIYYNDYSNTDPHYHTHSAVQVEVHYSNPVVVAAAVDLELLEVVHHNTRSEEEADR